MDNQEIQDKERKEELEEKTLQLPRCKALFMFVVPQGFEP